ncbi:class I SAM-dependent methyltransferase [Candidatus Omnitrophota bacterium]
MGRDKKRLIGRPARGDIKSAVRRYWEDPDTVSIIDRNLHRLEIDTVLRYLRPGDSIADIGCGDGAATVEYAKKVRRCRAFERSDHLRKAAARNIRNSGIRNITLEAGDVLAPGNIKGRFDRVITQRVLINLASWAEQKQAIRNVYGLLKPGGLYIMIENTNDAFSSLNKMRASVALKPINRHWHNLFFDHGKLMDFLKRRFQVAAVCDFGLYYFLTRVYVQMFANFVGFGKKAHKDPIFDSADSAARVIYEKFKGSIRIGGHRAVGPIQAFILKKKKR